MRRTFTVILTRENVSHVSRCCGVVVKWLSRGSHVLFCADVVFSFVHCTNLYHGSFIMAVLGSSD